MPALSLNHVNLRAEQPMLDALRDFYVDVVGLQVGWRPPFDLPGYWLYAGDQPVVHLIARAPHGGAAAPRAGSFDHVSFSSSGLAAFEARLQACNVVYRRDAVPATGQVQLFMQDPSGNGVELTFVESDDV